MNYQLLYYYIYILAHILSCIIFRLKKIQDKKKIANKKKEQIKKDLKEAEYSNMLDEGDEDLLF